VSGRAYAELLAELANAPGMPEVRLPRRDARAIAEVLGACAQAIKPETLREVHLNIEYGPDEDPPAIVRCREALAALDELV